MSKRNLDPGADRVVRLSQDRIGGTRRLVSSSGGGLREMGSRRGVWSDLEQSTHSQSAHSTAGPPDADRSIDSPYRKVLTFFMEGFAVYGASVYPTGQFPVHEMLRSAAARKEVEVPVFSRATTIELAELQPTEERDAGAPECAVWVGVSEPRHQTWLRSLGETIAALWVDGRQGREVKRVVAAPNASNDRTLRDMAIRDQPDGERMV